MTSIAEHWESMYMYIQDKTKREEQVYDNITLTLAINSVKKRGREITDCKIFDVGLNIVGILSFAESLKCHICIKCLMFS